MKILSYYTKQDQKTELPTGIPISGNQIKPVDLQVLSKLTSIMA
jgi:hypothetical protein